MKRIVRLTESDLTRIVRRVISEQEQTSEPMVKGQILGTLSSANVNTNIIGDTYGSQGRNKTLVGHYEKNSNMEVSYNCFNKQATGRNRETNSGSDVTGKFQPSQMALDICKKLTGTK